MQAGQACSTSSICPECKRYLGSAAQDFVEMLDLKPDERVLDVGCGIGVSARPNAFCVILSSSQA